MTLLIWEKFFFISYFLFVIVVVRKTYKCEGCEWEGSDIKESKNDINVEVANEVVN
jgi:hypothetical protein